MKDTYVPAKTGGLFMIFFEFVIFTREELRNLKNWT